MSRLRPQDDTCVYWLLGADDELLYVGMTRDLQKRMDQHRAVQPWWPEVVSVAHGYPTFRANARVLEAEDIFQLNPRYNIAGKAPVRAPLAEPYLSLLARFEAAFAGRTS